MYRSPLLHFLLIGALLFGLQSATVSVSNPIVVRVLRSEIDEGIAAYQAQMGRKASTIEADAIEGQIIENALWLEQARALGLHESDSVVRQRLVLNMRFLEDRTDLPENELFERALALGMDRSDTVVRRRLIDRVQAMIRAGVRSRNPDEIVLRAHYESTLPDWRLPARLDLTHVYFSRDRRGHKAESDAAALLPKLTRQALEPATAVSLADPFLAGHRIRSATPNRIVALFGPALSEHVEHAPVHRWIGPIESAFGAHLIWIHERIESRIPAFLEIRERVREDWLARETRRALRAQIDRRRRIVDVRVIEDRDPPQAPIERRAGI